MDFLFFVFIVMSKMKKRLKILKFIAVLEFFNYIFKTSLVSSGVYGNVKIM